MLPLALQVVGCLYLIYSPIPSQTPKRTRELNQLLLLDLLYVVSYLHPINIFILSLASFLAGLGPAPLRLIRCGVLIPYVQLDSLTSC